MRLGQINSDFTEGKITAEEALTLYEQERVESLKQDGARFLSEEEMNASDPEKPEVSGTETKKAYVIVCDSGDHWEEIHEILMRDGTLEDNIPSRSVECIDPFKTAKKMGTYLLSDVEVEEIRKLEYVVGANLDPEYYAGNFQGKFDQPRGFLTKTNRYGENVSIGRDVSSLNIYPTTPGSNLNGRAGMTLWRHMQQSNPWAGGVGDAALLTGDPAYYGDGSNVDAIVCDESGWYGHIEFINTADSRVTEPGETSKQPVNFKGTNVLKEGFAPSATTGVCGVLDVILDAPYYIDPDFFEADPSNRLTLRWDGTTVPVESVARDWWNTESTATRSAKFVSTNIAGGTAVIGSPEDFGTAFVSSNYTRANSNGSDEVKHTGGGYHSTPCQTQVYGKQAGWAFNSNKWHMSIIWSTGAVSITTCWRAHIVFHQLKPNDPVLGTKNPTVTSHSWGRWRYTLGNSSTAYYYHRQDGTGTGGVQYDSGSRPEMFSNFYQSNKMSAASVYTHSEAVLGREVIDSGVIFLSAAGNDRQKMVLNDHADFNNYESSSNNSTLATALNGNGTSQYTFNRMGFPSDLGWDTDGDGKVYYPSFNVGALDDDHYTDSTGRERKAVYSNSGNAIDFYTNGDASVAGCDHNTFTRYNRYDAYYTISGNNQSSESENSLFGGTSSACPVGAGMIATKMQHERNWGWQDVKNWLRQLDRRSSSEYYPGTEGTSPEQNGTWSDSYNLHDDTGESWLILYDAPTPNTPKEPNLGFFENVEFDGDITLDS